MHRVCENLLKRCSSLQSIGITDIHSEQLYLILKFFYDNRHTFFSGTVIQCVNIILRQGFVYYSTSVEIS